MSDVKKTMDALIIRKQKLESILSSRRALAKSKKPNEDDTIKQKSVKEEKYVPVNSAINESKKPNEDDTIKQKSVKEEKYVPVNSAINEKFADYTVEDVANRNKQINLDQSNEVIPQINITHQDTLLADFLNASNQTRVQCEQDDSDIIEDSSRESSYRDSSYISQKSYISHNTHALTIASSSEDDLNTSTYCLPRSHPYFGNNNDQNSSMKIAPVITPNPNKKIKVLSSVTLKTMRKSKEITCTNTYALTKQPANLPPAADLETQIDKQKPANLPSATDLDTKIDITGGAEPHLSTKEPENSPSAAILESHIDFSSTERHLSTQKPAKSPFAADLDTKIDFASTKPHLPTQQPANSPSAGNIETHTDFSSAEPQSFTQEPANLPLAADLDTQRDVFSNDKCHTSAQDFANLPNAENIDTHNSNSDNTEVIASTSNLRKRRYKPTKKSYIDFLSDGEKEDFSSGSSDYWSDHEGSSSDEGISKNKKKRKKKNIGEKTNNQEIKKKEKPINKRKITKSLKNEGKSYKNRDGKTVSEKVMKQNPCTSGICTRGCFDIPEERRESLFKHFWSLEPQRRRDWLLRCGRVVPIKRRKKGKDIESRRNTTYEYTINAGEDHQQVCQKFLLCTLDITQKYLMYTISHANENTSQEDKRKPNATLKYTEAAKTNVHTFIKNLPAVPSHYNRKKTSRTYLPEELKNVSNLYQIYLQECDKNGQEKVSDKVFRSIFHEYNISFHVPKKDKCVTCSKAEYNKETMTEKENEMLEKHKIEKIATYKRFKIHQSLKSLFNDTITCSFDMQKVLNTPHGQSMLLFYSRKYAVYNLTFYESSTQDVYCYTWGECDGKRGSCEIATCLMNYLQELDKRGFKHAILYCDSCSGQNKNRTVLASINHFLKSADNLEVIQLNFLLPGHTYMPVDSVHAVIEREIQKVIVWSPSQWATYFEAARKRPRPYKVNVMDHTQFLDFEPLANNTFTPATLKTFKFNETRVATFKKKNPDQMFVKVSMQEETFIQTIRLFERPTVKGKGKGKGKRSKGKNSDVAQTSEKQAEEVNMIKRLYNSRLPISAAKYKDLIRLCNNGTIPKRFHDEYRNLPYKVETRDSLNETDEEDGDEDDKTKE